MQRSGRSLKFKIGVFCVFLMVALAALLGYNNYSAFTLVRQQTYNTIRDTTYVQRNRISDSLAAVDAYLTGFVYNDATLNQLQASSRDTSEWFLALYALRNNFNAATAVHIAEDYFFYLPADDLFVTSTVGVGRSLKEPVQQALDTEAFFTSEATGKWVPLHVDGTWYLVRTLRVRGAFLGAVVSVDALLKPLFGDDLQNLYFDIAQQDGTLLRAQPVAEILTDYVADTARTYRFITIEGSRQLLVSHPLPRTNLSLVVLSPDVAVEATAMFFQNVLLVVLAGLAVILVVWFCCVQVWVMRPVRSLTAAIRRLHSGDMSAAVDATAYSAEFDEMNTAFNQMVKEIRTLKIDVYEEQLSRQNAQMEYLKLQVTPHFLINCLNTVYQLTEASRPDLTLRMVKDLSTHLRYMLGSGAAVSLRQEAMLVENFVELSGIRYPGCIRLHTHFDEAALDATAIPLLLLNFVENTVKYEVGMGKIVEIHLRVRKQGDRVHACIWDTGQGFSAQMLARLQNMNRFIAENKNKHIGISNVFQRARLILGPTCRFAFCNREDAGAQVSIDFPYIPYQPQEETE